jgi:hypothetical protein
VQQTGHQLDSNEARARFLHRPLKQCAEWAASLSLRSPTNCR